MITWDDVRAAIAELPGTSETTKWGRAAWAVDGNVFAIERPLSKADIKRLGDADVPQGPILLVSVLDLDDKQAILETAPKGVFTIEHFDGYAALLLQLDVVGKRTFKTMLRDAWRIAAPASSSD